MKNTRFHSERGATAVLMAFSMIGLLAFGGLVLDGGNAFSQRRQMQNAADSSAMAGANALYRWKQAPSAATVNTIYSSALAKAQENGAAPGTFTCTLVFQNAAGDETGTKDCSSATASDLTTAWKVRVYVDQTSSTRLMKVVDIDSFKAKANAAASLLEGIGAVSPFMTCAAPGAHGEAPEDLLKMVAGEWQINQAAIGYVYDIWRNEVKDASDCGIGSSNFRGLVETDGGANYQIPGSWTYKPGNTSGEQVNTSLIGGCDLPEKTKVKDITPGCEFVVPLCTYASADKKSLWCVKLGRFVTVDTGSKGIQARFLGGGLLNSGQAGGIPVNTANLLIIKLTE
jgi:Flp pilus assembly protein TadG